MEDLVISSPPSLAVAAASTRTHSETPMNGTGDTGRRRSSSVVTNITGSCDLEPLVGQVVQLLKSLARHYNLTGEYGSRIMFYQVICVYLML